MRVDRRMALKGSAALAALPLVAKVAMTPARLIVFDSRVPESASFATRHAGPRLDLAREHETRWADLRGDLAGIGEVQGLTGWSDWIAVRGELEARGLRFGSEDRVAAPLSGKSHLFRWSMKSR